MSSSPFSTEHLQQVDSTNAELLRRAASHSIHALAVTADVQLAGRGQRGRRWHAAPGDALLLSVGWEFAPSVRLDGLSLAVGVAVARAAAPFSQQRITLKWPNDLLVDDQAKLAGILVETVNGFADKRAAVIGIGVNVRPPLSPDFPAPTGHSALAALPAAALVSSLLPRVADGAPIIISALKQSILAELSSVLPEFAAHGFSAFRDEWWSRRAYASVAVQLTSLDVSPALSQTMNSISGRLHDLDPNGALIINDGRSLHTLHSGLLSMRPA